MITTDTIYSLASRDARTGAIPKKDKLAPGQRAILAEPKFSSIKNSYDELQRKVSKRNDLLREGLSLQSVFEEDTSKSTTSFTDLTSDLEQAKTDLDLLDVEIENEQTLLTNRGIVFPSNTTIDKDSESLNIEQKSMWDVFMIRLSVFWNTIKKPLGRFTMFAAAEVFVAFLLWDILRDHKSELQTILRIAASAVIFATLHFAERKYKRDGRWWDIAYIIYAWLSAVVLLFGSIVVVTAFPEALNTTPSLEQTFDLNATNTVITSTKGHSWLSSYVRYDFLIAVVCLLIFMLMSILDKSKPKVKKEKTKDVEVKIEATVNPVFVPLLNLYTRRNTQAKEVSKLSTEVEYIESKPTNLANRIDQKLQSLREEVERLDKDISSIKTEIDKMIDKVAALLSQYEVDYTDVFKNKVASNFETPEWVEKPEIINYYNIKI
jgi:peptidoglycan hydrolase CwlO-like protein